MWGGWHSRGDINNLNVRLKTGPLSVDNNVQRFNDINLRIFCMKFRMVLNELSSQMHINNVLIQASF